MAGSCMTGVLSRSRWVTKEAREGCAPTGMCCWDTEQGEDITRTLICFALQFALDDRSATVQLGTTTVMAAITAELTAPFNERAREGTIKCV